jgi:rubrerythrin
MKNTLNEMMSVIPSEKGKNTDLQILRDGIISEMDAISLYEQLSEIATDPKVKKVLLDIAKEEKTHAGEFKTLLSELDIEQKKENKIGEKEVEDLTNMKEAKERIYGKTSMQELNEMKIMFNKLIK